MTAELEGHIEAERQLGDAFHAGTLAHAWMICGPEGVGKATLAYRFARYVLKNSGHAKDTPRPGEVPDAGSLFGDDDAVREATGEAADGAALLAVHPDDPVFRRVASGGHADLAVIRRAIRNIKTGEMFNAIRVDDIRGVGAFLRRTPAEGGWRVVIIDAADDMNLNAQNALLKVLEEPPANSLILLVCHAPGRLLPTIRSRCRQLILRPLTNRILRHLIDRHVADLPPETSEYLAALSEGSIGRALQIIDGDGIELHSHIKKIFDNLPKLDAPKVHELAGRIVRRQESNVYGVALQLIDHHLRDHIRSIALDGSRVRSLEPWLAVWDKSIRLRNRAESVNLDRKQVIIGIFHAVADAAEASA